MLRGKMNDFPLKYFISKRIGPYRTQIKYETKRRVGHFDFSIFLLNKKGQKNRLPIVKGIYSKGNRNQHIFPWIDVHYFDEVDFGEGAPIKLSQSGSLAEDLFRLIGCIIPSGGMIFLSYITDISWGLKSELHEITRRSLSLSSICVPAAATPLGHLLLISGCRNIKSGAYDVQGSARLAGEKSLTSDFNAIMTKKLIAQLKQYLAKKPHSEFVKLEKSCRSLASRILNQMSVSLDDTGVP